MNGSRNNPIHDHLCVFAIGKLRIFFEPADLMFPDYSSEPFRMFKKNEIRQFGEYRTQMLVLEARHRLFGS
jgi:hypothetical protein